MKVPALRLFAGLLALLVTGCAEGPDGAGPSTSPRPGMRPGLAQVADRMPATVADFTRGDRIWHETDRPGYGVAFDYAGPARSAVATVSLYDRGEPRVPPGIASATLQREFALSVQDALAMADQRTSQRLAEGARTELAVPGQAPLQCVELRGTYGRAQLRTLICLGEAAGYFLKVQVTAPERQVQPVDPLPFIVGVARAARG